MLKAFLSYPFRPECERFARDLAGFLAEQDVEVVDGRLPDATAALPDYIQEQIAKCDLLISLLFEGVESRWVDHEIGFALGKGLEVLVIIDGNVTPSGIVSQQLHINRSQGELTLSTALSKALKTIRKKIGAGANISISVNAPFDEIEEEGWPPDVMNKVTKLRDLFKEVKFDRALQLAGEYREQHPTCWRFGIAASSALIHQRRFSEARQILQDVISRFPSSPRALSYAYDNLGWLHCEQRRTKDKKSLEEELEFYEEALRHEDRFVTYVNEVQCLLDLNRIRRAEEEFVRCLKRFPRAIDGLRKQVKVQGAEFVQNITKSDLLSALLFEKQEE